MAGMLQIITYLLGVYLVMKGIEILQIGLTSTRPDRRGLIFIGIAALIICVATTVYFVNARSLSRGVNP